MRFLLDENAEFRIAAFLTERGHDVTAVAHDYPHALSDREGLAHAGVIYFRLALESPTAEKIEWLRQILEQFPPRGIRYRP